MSSSFTCVEVLLDLRAAPGLEASQILHPSESEAFGNLGGDLQHAVLRLFGLSQQACAFPTVGPSVVHAPAKVTLKLRVAVVKR